MAMLLQGVFGLAPTASVAQADLAVATFTAQGVFESIDCKECQTLTGQPVRQFSLTNKTGSPLVIHMVLVDYAAKKLSVDRPVIVQPEASWGAGTAGKPFMLFSGCSGPLVAERLHPIFPGFEIEWLY